MKKFAALGMIVAGGLLAPQMASAIVIDSFDEGLVNLTADVMSPVQTVRVSDASILGGERDVKVEWKTTSSPGTAVTTKIDAGNSNLLAHSQESGAFGRTTITWDGADNSDALAFGLAQDFTTATVAGFNFDLISADLNGVLTLDVYTSSTEWSTVTYNFPSNIVPPGQFLFFPLSSFSKGLTALDKVKWENVNAIVLTIDGWNQDALDVRVDQLDTSIPNGVPEPVSAGLSLMGLGALALTASKRRA